MQKHKSLGRASMAYSIDGRELLGHLLTDVLQLIPLDRPLADFLAMDPSELLDYAQREASASLQKAGEVAKFAVWSQVVAFLKKNKSLDFGIAEKERQAAALSKFFQSERRCARANKRLKHFRTRQSRSPMSTILEMAALTIQSALPNVWECYEDILDNANFGPGSTDQTTFAERGLYFKVSSHQTMTAGCREMFIDYIRRNPRWVASSECIVNYTDHDVLAFVEKNATIKRTICKQPSLNLFLQKGVEAVMIKTLRRVGITLHNQERNGQLACRASLIGGYATVDLVSASDSVCIELVRWLLPPDWFALLDALRTKKSKLPDGRIIDLAKFSAMGNAFTFPLESLIFWALTMAVYKYTGEKAEWRVYGDDLICSQSCALLLVEALQFAGFGVNVEKSFFFGDFRESCGFDCVAGTVLTPLYVRSTPKRVTEVYNLYNRLLCHEWFSFPSTLAYLHRSVQKPHKGPWSQPRKDLGYWVEGFNPQLDSYFISDPPQERLWDADCQRWVYPTPVLVERYATFKVDNPNIQMHLVLLGVTMNSGGWISDPSRPKLRQATIEFSNWPTLASVFQQKRRRLASGSMTGAACISVSELNSRLLSRVDQKLEQGLP